MIKLNSKFHKLEQQSRLYKLEKPLIGLTGGIACGKSTVSKMFSELGVKIIDADELVKSIYRDPQSLSFIKGQFPDCIIDNKINFKSLREIFFKSPEAKKIVEAFIYKHLEEEFRKKAMEIEGQDFYFYDVPLLFEKDLSSKFDFKIVVDCSQETQLKNLLKRDHLSIDSAQEILKHQMDLQKKKELADVVLDNSGDLDYLSQQVHKLWDFLFS